MRWWVGILGFLLAVGIAAMVFRRPAPTRGQQLAAALQKQGVILRSAIPLLDYAPPTTDSSGLNSGAGSLNGGELVPVYNQRWIRAKDTEFVWQRTLGGNPGDEPLRQAITADAQPKVLQALAAAAPDGATLEAALAKATQQLDRMTDEQLFSAWLAADRGVLAETDDWPRAARECLLLAARQNSGPAISFRSGVDDVYLLPLDTTGDAAPAGSLVWTQMEAYDNGRLAWTGVMSMGGAPAPDAVRRMAARMAAEVARSGPFFR